MEVPQGHKVLRGWNFENGGGLRAVEWQVSFRKEREYDEQMC